ncbi:MAG: protease HtpX [Gammaproteobacteria bacterium]
MLRIILLLATNFAVMLLASMTLNILGVGPMMTANGLNLTSLIIFGSIVSFGGAFFSLAISKWMAKKSMGVHIIEQARTAEEAWLVETVRRQAKAAGIGMPEVGIFDAPEPNAFATGARRDAALVAVSTGLLRRMRRDEVEAVLGHEVSHVANGDMVTQTLLMGVMNTFVFVFSRIIGSIVDNLLRGNRRDEGPGIGFFIGSFVAQIVLGLLANLIVMWFSRRREYRADEGGAKLSSRESMIGALEALKRASAPEMPENMAAFGISASRGGGLRALFTTHPPLDERIAALRAMR